MSQLRVYCSSTTSRAIGTGPNTNGKAPSQSTAPALGSPVRVQTSTTGESLGLNVPTTKLGLPLGSGTTGGRKKKSGFPPLCVPSEIRNAGPAVVGGCTG